MTFTLIQNLQIIGVGAKGQLANERVVLRARRECSLGHYLVLDSTFDGEQISEKNRHVYWFPDWDVGAGDFVLLYTREGRAARTVRRRDGSIAHIFYWGLDRSVWNEDGDAVTLLHTSRLEYEPV